MQTKIKSNAKIDGHYDWLTERNQIADSKRMQLWINGMINYSDNIQGDSWIEHNLTQLLLLTDLEITETEKENNKGENTPCL